MSLVINKSENVFELAGILNQSNAEELEKILTKALKKYDKLVLSIEDIESMDRYGVDAITKLHYDAKNSNKSITIIGDGCKDLYDHFRSSAAA